MNATYSASSFSATPPAPPGATGLAGPHQPAGPAAEAAELAGYLRLQELLEQAPVAMCLLRGPMQVIDLVNPAAAASWGRSIDQLRGQAFFEALPDLRGQGYEAAYATVWHTQQGVAWKEAPLTVTQNPGGRVALGYFDVSFQPFYTEQRQMTGILVTSHEVTEQVLARQYMQQATKELAATNAGLADYVTELTRAAHAAQGYAECHADSLTQLLEQAPMAIGLFVGADYVVEVCNPGLRVLWGRTLAQVYHQPLFEVLPELLGQGLRELLDKVGRTGEPAVAPQLPGPGGPAVPTTFLYYSLRDSQGRSIAIAAVAAYAPAQAG